MNADVNTMENFQPHGALEDHLLKAQEGTIPGDEFMQYLLTQQVFFPIKDEKHQIAGLQVSQKAIPLSLPTEEGIDFIAVFTSPERAKPFVHEHCPDYGGGLLVEFKWILEKLGIGDFGIILNPGWSVGIEMEPNMVKQLQQEHKVN